MVTFKRTIVAVSFALALTETVNAATLLTPPVLVEASGGFSCTAFNVSSGPREISIQILRGDGQPAVPVGATVAPEDAFGQNTVNVSSSRAGMMGKFEVDGAKSTVRAACEVRDSGGVQRFHVVAE